MKTLLAAVIMCAPALAADPVSVRLVGPPEGLAVLGDMVRIAVETTGNVKHYKWKVAPPNADGFVPAQDNKSVLFANRNAGRYVIMLAVSGDDGVDFASLDLEIVPQPVRPVRPGPVRPEPEPEPTQPDDPGPLEAPPPRPRPRQQPAPRPQRRATAATRPGDAAFLSWVGAVGAPLNELKAEARVLSGDFKSTAARVRTGQVPQGTSPFADVQAQAQVSLGTSWARWQRFFVAASRGSTDGDVNSEAWYRRVADLLSRVQ